MDWDKMKNILLLYHYVTIIIAYFEINNIND